MSFGTAAAMASRSVQLPAMASVQSPAFADPSLRLSTMRVAAPTEIIGNPGNARATMSSTAHPRPHHVSYTGHAVPSVLCILLSGEEYPILCHVANGFM